MPSVSETHSAVSPAGNGTTDKISFLLNWREYERILPTFQFSSLRNADEPSHSNVSDATPYHAPIFLAQSKGYFTEENIKVAIIEVSAHVNSLSVSLGRQTKLCFCRPYDSPTILQMSLSLLVQVILTWEPRLWSTQSLAKHVVSPSSRSERSVGSPCALECTVHDADFGRISVMSWQTVDEVSVTPSRGYPCSSFVRFHLRMNDIAALHRCRLLSQQRPWDHVRFHDSPRQATRLRWRVWQSSNRRIVRALRYDTSRLHGCQVRYGYHASDHLGQD